MKVNQKLKILTRKYNFGKSYTIKHFLAKMLPERTIYGITKIIGILSEYLSGNNINHYVNLECCIQINLYQ